MKLKRTARKTESAKRSIKRSSPILKTGRKLVETIRKKIRKDPRMFGIYVIDDSDRVRFIRFMSKQNEEFKVSYEMVLVDSFDECSKFINADSAKNRIEQISRKHHFRTIKPIEKTKLESI